ncbi:MAG: FAD:protein FMN transferase [Coriobacteriales bacterium]|jgi:thiamine biosynthesis lipoprotein|nr:FAD:protein FMN transferase [Coriobacteriales bacterium]
MPAISQQTEPQTVTGYYFDTVCTISASVDKGILDDALALCSTFNDLLSKTVEGSDVWRINHAQGQAVAVSEHTLRNLQVAFEGYRATYGAFNIAVAAAVDLWDVMGSNPHIPAAAELEAALALSDLSALELDLEQSTVRLPAGVRIDLGGIAKGYIVDQIAAYLRGRGVTSALLNFGGTVVSIGRRADGKPWNIGLHHPKSELREGIFAVVASEDGCVVTSGAYERGFDLDGVRYHHILDPRTGWPTELKLTSVTIVGNDATRAEVLSTALFILSTEEGLELAADWGFSVVLYGANNAVTYTQGLPLTLLEGQ